MKSCIITDAALTAAAWEISAVDYPDYEPDLERARLVLEAALPHVLTALADDLDGQFTELRRAQGKSFDWLCGIADAEQHIRDGEVTA